MHTLVTSAGRSEGNREQEQKSPPKIRVMTAGKLDKETWRLKKQKNTVVICSAMSHL